MTDEAPKRKQPLDPSLFDWHTESFSSQERDAMLAWYAEVHGAGTVSHVEFLINHDPATLKRYRRYSANVHSRLPEGLPPGIAPLFFLHYYVILAYEPGVVFEGAAVHEMGFNKAQIKEVLSWAFLEAGPRGMNAAAGLAASFAEWEDEESTFVWPEGWHRDRSVFEAGLDFSTDVLSAAELQRLEAWHRRVHGTVPEHVTFLAAHHPKALKTFRNRYEKALGQALPVQVAPLLTLHLATVLSRLPAIRLAAKQALAFGVTPQQIVETACWGFLNGGQTAMDTAAAVIAETLAEPSRVAAGLAARA